MNKIVLIGNGFDLAHGLKTKYGDFILWYLNKAIEESGPKLFFEDQLLIIENSGGSKNIINSLGDFKKLESLPGFKVKVKSNFFKRIVSESAQFGWVDIERLYFSELVGQYNSLNNGTFDRDTIINKFLNELNNSFDYIKTQLQEYLSSIDYRTVIFDDEIWQHFTKNVFNETLSNHISSKPGNSKILFLNFNYTSSVELYLQDDLLKGQFSIINIHGKLNDSENPIIFGYGDEMDPNYEKLERLNINKFLTKFKSFGYFKTRNYQDFTKFLEIGDFEVLIMGHSCGLSDRILLNSIFEHKYCKSIRIFYHQRDEYSDDYYDKTIEISRHFNAKGKSLMRDRIVPYTKSAALKKYRAL